MPASPPPHNFVPQEPLKHQVVSQRAVALDTLIRSSLEELRRDGEKRLPTEALLFVGNWNDALPRLLIHDQILEPVDKIVWAVIRTRADPQRGTAFPSYATIGKLANVGSEATVARALAVLRVTRWLTLCGRARDPRGRYRGNVYALHDEPLPLVDTLYLDQAYMEFAYLATAHNHARVALVATGVVRSFEMDVAAGQDVPGTDDPISQRIAAQLAINQDVADDPSAPSARTEAPSVYGLRGRLREQLRHQFAGDAAPGHLQNLKTASNGPHLQISKAADHLQILKTVEPQNLSPVVVSSSKNSTTTTAEAYPVGSLGTLRWPQNLMANHRHLAAIQLREIPIDLRQVVLNILDQRLLAIDRGAERLHYGPLAYLKTLCAKARSGQLVLPQSTSASLASSGTAQSEPRRVAIESRTQAHLRIARADHAHFQRILALETDDDRRASILGLVEGAASEVGRLEAELASEGPAHGVVTDNTMR